MVRLELDSRHESPGLVRAALTGVAEILELEPELFDDLKTAVNEACNNVVLHAYNGALGRFLVDIEIQPNELEVTVRDWGGGIRHVAPSEERMGVGLGVISALSDRAEFISAPDGGTEVRMVFTARGATFLPPACPAGTDPAAELPVLLSGDVIVRLSPVGLLPNVLGRVARAVAARTHLSLDRFSDLYLVTDAIASFANAAASAGEIVCAVAGGYKRLELTVGPFRAGDGARLRENGLSGAPGSPLAQLVGELELAPVNGFEMLRVVVAEADQRERAAEGR